MASFKLTLLLLTLSAISIAFARVIGRKSLSERVSDIIGKFPRRIPERPFPLPWLTIKPPHFPIKPPKPVDPPLSERNELDLAFIMDTTGSMSPYIDNVRQHIKELVDEIVKSSNTNLRIALIEYRDHGPRDVYITRIHHFTSSVSTMKSWLNAASARFGGDLPEAVADAMYAATTLGWRANAAKISILVTDAPPHGLIVRGDSLPSGSLKHDPIDLAHKFAAKGIALYTVGCEPSINPYTDFFMALALLTGGQYIPLRQPRLLTSAVVAGAKEELSLKKFSADVRRAIKKEKSAGRAVNEQQIAKSVFSKLKSEGATAQQLLKNNQPLEGATAKAKAMAAAKSMAEVKKLFNDGKSSGRSSGVSRSKGVPFRRRISSAMKRPTARLELARGSSGRSGSGGGESFTAVKKAVSLDQISRLVRLEAAKLSA